MHCNRQHSFADVNALVGTVKPSLVWRKLKETMKTCICYTTIPYTRVNIVHRKVNTRDDDTRSARRAGHQVSLSFSLFASSCMCALTYVSCIETDKMWPTQSSKIMKKCLLALYELSQNGKNNSILQSTILHARLTNWKLYVRFFLSLSLSIFHDNCQVLLIPFICEEKNYCALELCFNSNGCHAVGYERGNFN